jgi:hypothetical protein
MPRSVLALIGCEPGPRDPAGKFVLHFHRPSKAFIDRKSVV